MGEYTKDGRKMGTCEDMYYMRFTQRARVVPDAYSLNPNDPDIVTRLRFRFPWPEEDAIEVGHFDGAYKSVWVAGYRPENPGEVDHGTVQFRADAGYLVSLPCPEGKGYAGDNMAVTHENGTRVHRNGFRGAVHLVAQKFVPSIGLVPVVRCGGCGSMWRIEDRPEIERLALAFRAAGDRDRRDARGENTTAGDWHHAVADRILAGIEEGVPA
jgi:hypothetical protein